jgi:hypothetical protein
MHANPNRREFLGKAGSAVLLAGSVPRVLQADLLLEAPAEPSTAHAKASRRTIQCAQIKKDAALTNARMATPANRKNGDDQLQPAGIACYHKGLAHNETGEVDFRSYRAMKHALETGRPADFEKIPLGGNIKLSNPQGGLAFDLEACDSHQTFMATPPSLASAWRASEMVEGYWMALLRDVNFADYPTNATAASAIAELNRQSDFRGPRQKNRITAQTLFRGCTPGDLVGPYVSQFLLQPFKFGALNVNQQYAAYQPTIDYMTDAASWLRVQNGQGPFEENTLDRKPRYIRNGRDLSAYVHFDGPYQPYLAAALWMMQNDVMPNVGNPYNKSHTQEGFQTFGGPHVLSLLAEVSNRALKAVWFHKWYVHRTLRPEAYGGLVHWTMNGTREYPVHSDVLNSQAVANVYSKYGSYLLPNAYPEGCPQHPSYGQGHAAIAGACVTILKAFFSTDTVTFFDPVEASRDGLSLVPYKGPDVWQMSVTNELHKLAGNIGMARNMAGIHWRSDYDQALLLGEMVAMSLLRDQRGTFNEDFSGFTLNKFDGSAVTV